MLCYALYTIFCVSCSQTFFITRAIVRRAYVRTLGLKAFADESCSEFKAFVRIYINRVMITRTRETMMNEANI